MSGRLKLLKEKVQVLRNKMVYTRKCETLPTDGKEYFLKWRDWQRWAAHRNRVRIHDTVYLGTSLDDEAVYMRFSAVGWRIFKQWGIQLQKWVSSSL